MIHKNSCDFHIQHVKRHKETLKINAKKNVYKIDLMVILVLQQKMTRKHVKTDLKYYFCEPLHVDYVYTVSQTHRLSTLVFFPRIFCIVL